MARPWEINQGVRPWEISAGAQPIYNRTVSIRRSTATPDKGQVDYQGVDINAEGPVTGAQGLPCSIQLYREGQSVIADLPSDARKAGQWRFMIPAIECPLGVIKKEDIAVDDLGIRYLIDEPVYDVFGYAFIATTAEV